MKRCFIGLLLLSVCLGACSAHGPGARTSGASRPYTGLSPDLDLSDRDRALGAFLKGEVAMQNGDYDTALEAYQRAARLDPDEPRLHARLAHLYVRRGELERAHEAATFAVTKRPDDIPTRMLLAGTLVGLGREQAAAEEYREVIGRDSGTTEAYLLLSALYTKWGEPEKARIVLERLVEADPGSVMGYYYLGRLHAGAGRLDDARDSFGEALRRNGRSVLILTDLALVEEMRGSSQEANLLYRRVLALDPGNEVARRRLAGMLAGQKRYDEALQEFRQLERIEADPTETRLKIGLIYLEKGDFDAAATELNLVRRENPDDHSVAYYLGIVYAETGEVKRSRDVLATVPADSPLYAESRLQMAYLAQREDDLDSAVDYAKQALDVRPESSGIIEFLIALERDRKNLPQAVSLAERLVAKSPSDDRYHFMLGALYDEAGDRPAALEQMREAIEMNPENAAALNYLGYSLAESGKQLDEAERLVKRALAVDPNDGFYIDSLGWVFYQSGRYRQAVEQLERAVELTGDDPTINEHLADAYRKVGRELEALQLYREALSSSTDDDQRRRIETKVRAVERAGSVGEPSL